MSLSDMMQNELPLNRKEKFFTGTVFPMIVCKDNFKHFPRLLGLIGCDEEVTVIADPDTSNIQFFTEYSLVESIVGPAESRFLKPPTSKDTPDVMALIRAESGHKLLIAIEAKMYDVPTALSLQMQLDNQWNNILSYLKDQLQIDRLYHYALLPKALHDTLEADGFDYETITWEDLLGEYSQVYDNDYFLELLRIALESYGELVSRRMTFLANCEKKIPGAEIYDKFKKGILCMNVMGRAQGLTGEHLQKDIASGRWKVQWYETSSADTPPNRNWFHIRRFVEHIDKEG